MQPLSEAWATAYVQILITLIIFALGIPALAIQLVVEDDIRTVFQRRWKLSMWFLMVLLILGAFFVFVWILHPPFTKAGKEPKLDIPITLSSPEPQRTSPANFVITVGSPVSTGGVQDSMADFASPVASILMTIIPMGILGLGSLYTVYLRRQHIIKSLEEDLIESFEERSLGQRLFTYMRNMIIKKKKSRKTRSKKNGTPAGQSQTPFPRHLDKDVLDDLIFLGLNGKAGKDKTLVLDAFERIAAKVQDRCTYQGDELEKIIRGVRDILLNGAQRGNDDNFNQAARILRVTRLSQHPGTSKYIDALLADEILEELGIEAIKTKSEQIAERYLEEASFSSKIVLEMGLIALNNKQFHTANFALNKLETLAEDRRLAACSATFDLLGLLAHFSYSGTSSRMRADSFLADNISQFSPSIDYCLLSAHGHHYEACNFETADMIFELRQTIASGKWSPLRSLQ